METRVKSLRMGAYFRCSLIGSSGGSPLGYRGFILWMCASHRFLFLTVARLNRASLVSAVTLLLPSSTKYDFYFIPKHFSPAPVSHATETKNRYGVSRGDRVYQAVSLSPLVVLYRAWFVANTFRSMSAKITQIRCEHGLRIRCLSV